MIRQHTGDFSQTSYYPSCVVHLRIRLDPDARYNLPNAQSVDDLVTAGPIPTAQLFTLQGDGFSRVNGLIPMECSVELSSYRKGGKFSFKIPFRDFPIDPRLIKAGSAKIYAGTVTAADFARGLAESPPSSQSEQLYWRRRSLLAATDENLLISGPLDPPKYHIASGAVELSFEGRDNVAILADAQITPKLLTKLNVNQPIDAVIADILATHPLVHERRIDPFLVAVQREDWPNGVVRSPGTKDGITRVRQKADGQGAQMHPGADPTSSISFWDLIVQYCSLVAAVPWFRPDGTLEIRPAITLHDWKRAERYFDPTVKTPFAGNISRTVGEPAREIAYRRMVYGRNVEELTFERKTSGVKARVVQVVSIDDDAEGRGAAQKLLIGEFPKKGVDAKGKGDKKQLSAVTPDGDKASTDVLRVTVHGIRSQQVLEEIAQGIFNEVMHQEISGHCQTKDLSSFGGVNGDPDLLHLRVGDPVQILVDAAGFSASNPHVSEVLDHTRRSFEEEVAAIRPKVGNDENFARAVVATARNMVADLQNTFRVSGVKLDFSMAGDSPSVSIGFDFQNYVDLQYTGVNEAPGPRSGQQPTRRRP